MKLSTRLSIAVGIIVTLLSISIGSFAIISSQNSEIATVKEILNAATKQTINSSEDPYVVALLVTQTTSLPLAASVLTTSPELSFLVENSASIKFRPTPQQINSAKKSPTLVEDSLLIRAIDTDPGEFLIYSMSIKSAQEHSRSLLKALLLFILISLLSALAITYFLFRRDSQVNALARSLQENNERMQEFLGDASHELRTPLTVIKGYAELMSANPLNPDLPRYLENVKKESARMERLINELLLLAELGEGRSLDISEADISKLVSRKIEEVRDLNPNRVITSNLADVIIETDQALLEILLTNIFSNIIRHTPPDAPVAINLVKNKGGFTLHIEDGGPGLPNYSAQAFTRFDKSRSRESGGSGLGLSIMQKIAQTLGASISFTKSSLGGLAVTFDL